MGTNTYRRKTELAQCELNQADCLLSKKNHKKQKQTNKQKTTKYSLEDFSSTQSLSYIKFKMFRILAMKKKKEQENVTNLQRKVMNGCQYQHDPDYQTKTLK